MKMRMMVACEDGKSSGEHGAQRDEQAPYLSLRRSHPRGPGRAGKMDLIGEGTWAVMAAQPKASVP